MLPACNYTLLPRLSTHLTSLFLAVFMFCHLQSYRESISPGRSYFVTSKSGIPWVNIIVNFQLVYLDSHISFSKEFEYSFMF